MLGFANGLLWLWKAEDCFPDVWTFHRIIYQECLKSWTWKHSATWSKNNPRSHSSLTLSLLNQTVWKTLQWQMKQCLSWRWINLLKNHRVSENSADRHISQCQTGCTQATLKVWINLHLWISKTSEVEALLWFYWHTWKSCFDWPQLSSSHTWEGLWKTNPARFPTESIKLWSEKAHEN